MTLTISNTKIITGALVVALVFPLAFAPVPARAVATCVAGAVGGAAASAAGAVALVPVSVPLLQPVATAHLAAKCESNFVTEVLNGIAWAAAKAVVQSITQSLVQWINSGFEGSPAFETNLQASLLHAADGVVSDLLLDLGTTDQINAPWGNAISEGIALGYYLYTSPERLQALLRYNLQQFSSNPQAFLFGDFRYGGWNAWYAANTQCGNNPFCSRFTAHDELARRLDATISRELTIRNWGNGFLSWRGPCQKYAGGTTTNQEGESVPLTQDNGGGRCLQQEIRTPGSVIEGTLVHQLGSGVRQLELADSINEVIGALAAQLVNQVLSESGLLGTTRPSSGGRRPYLDQLLEDQTAPSTNPGINDLSEEVEAYITQVTTYRTNWETLHNAAEAATEELESCLSENSNDEVLAQTVEPVRTEAEGALEDANDALVELVRIAVALDSAQHASALIQLVEDLEEVQQLVTIAEVADSTTQAGTGEGTTLTVLQEIAETACD